MKRIPQIAIGLAGLAYLVTMAYFAFRPFQPVPGKLYPPMKVERDAEGAVCLRSGAALECPAAGNLIRKALMASGHLSVEVFLLTDSLGQRGPARIISFSRGVMSRNFTLGQEGHGLVFRLRTTKTGYNGQHRSLLVPMVFDDADWQHLVVTFDGTAVRLYIDGQLHPVGLDLGGDFSKWGRNHVLVVGDEVPGGRPWSGKIQRFAIYDRTLDAKEVLNLYENRPVPEPVFASGFQTMERLHYRNLFVTTDSAAYTLNDCIANIMGFAPLAGLAWLAFPAGLKKRKSLSVWILPLILGFVASLSIELSQRYIEGRVPCALDLVYNLLGTLFGCLLLSWLLTFSRGKWSLNKGTI